MLATVGLLLIGLIAAASFVVIAHRRMRQLGMLAAIGATEKQLRVGDAGQWRCDRCPRCRDRRQRSGLVGWFGVAPLVENAVGYRIDEFAVPWWLVVSAMLLAVVAGTAAAWWPARSVARVSRRCARCPAGRHEPKPARRAAALAAVFAVVGVACLALGGDLAADDDANWTHAALIVAGTMAVALAMLLACPPALRVLGGVASGASRSPYGSPSAISLATAPARPRRLRRSASPSGIAVTIIVSAAAAQACADEGNLPENQLLIRASHVDGPFIPEDAELDELHARRRSGRRIVRQHRRDVARRRDRSRQRGRTRPSSGRIASALAKRADDGWTGPQPPLRRHATAPRGCTGMTPMTSPPSTFVITSENGDFAILGDIKIGGHKFEPLPLIERLSPTLRLAARHLRPACRPRGARLGNGAVRSLAGRDERAAHPRAAGGRPRASGGCRPDARGPRSPDRPRRAPVGATAAGMLVCPRHRRDDRRAWSAARQAVTYAVLTATGATSRTRRTLTGRHRRRARRYSAPVWGSPAHTSA